jgi:hypothetical protein
MKCRECREQLQNALDSGQLVVSSEWGEHLHSCEPCRREVSAARVLLGGLASLSKPQTSRLLSASITAAIGADRQARRRRATYRLYATATLAASLLLLLGMGSLATLWKTPIASVAKPRDTKQADADLTQSADDAQKAVASLTRSVAANTKSRLNVFLPDPASLEVSLPALTGFDEPLDPAAQSLKQAGLSVAHSFEPIAHTTARAFDFFAREMPVLEFSKNE